MIDTGSEPGAWADALRLPPWIEDSDGLTFYNGAFLSPDVRFERLFDAGERSTDAAPFALSPCLHSSATSEKGQQDRD